MRDISLLKQVQRSLDKLGMTLWRQRAIDRGNFVLYHHVHMPEGRNINSPIAFDWDIYNKEKNRIKHQVDYRECEEIFTNRPLETYKDIKHSQCEERFVALGITNNRRCLYLVFTLRKNTIRIISARDMSRKERIFYEKK